MKKEVYVSVDVEATAGHSPGKYSMYQVGACLVKNIDLTFFAELRLLNDNFNPRSLKVCGVTVEELKKRGVEPAEAIQKFEEWIGWACGNGRPVFVGFNTPFDWKYVDWYFHNFLGRNPFGIGGIDIKSYQMGMMGSFWTETVKRKIKKQFPCSLHHTHNALDDAKEQAELFGKMLEFNQVRKAKLVALGLF